MKNLLPLSALFLGLITGGHSEEKTTALDKTKAPAPKTFLIILRPAVRLHDEKAWTDTDHAAVNAHFQRLKAATDRGQVILAGRTSEPLDKTIGLVVFTADDEAAAHEFMNGDPCVAAGVMTATLHPYDLALLRKN